MRRAFSIAPVLFLIFLLAVAVGLIFLLGNKAIKEGIIQTQEDVAIPEKQSAIEVAQKAAKSYNFYKSNGWGEIELYNNEWTSDNSNIEIRYFYSDLIKQGKSIILYVIVYPKEEIGGIYFGKKSKCMTLGLAEGKRERLPRGGFLEGQRILSPFGTIHNLSYQSEDYVSLDPFLTDADTSFPLLLLEDKKAFVEMFIINNEN